MKEYIAIGVSIAGIVVLIALALGGVIGSDHDAITQLKQQVENQSEDITRLEMHLGQMSDVNERITRVEEQVRILDMHLGSQLDAVNQKLIRMDNKMDLLGQLIYESLGAASSIN